MKTILCYGDSNTFGANPFGDADGVWRHPWEVRYPGRLQTLLGGEYRVVEEGLGGRTTVFNDPTSPNRIGLEFLPVCVESHCPDIVVLMLGTNDTKPDCCASVRMITDGMGQLVKAVLNPYAYWFDPPRVIIAAPVPLHDNLPNSSAYGIFDEQSVVKSKQLAQSFRSLAEMYRCDFADCGSVTTTTPEECVHLTAEAHDAIAKLLRDKILDK